LGLRYTEDKKSDNGGKAHVTAGYWSNAGQWNDPGTPDFYYESWGLLGVPRGSAAAAWADLGKDSSGAIIPRYVDGTNYGPNRFFQSNYIDATDGTNSPTFADRVSGDDNSYEAEWDKFTYKVGFDYDISNSAFVYGYVATGFKAGGFGDQVDLCGGHCTIRQTNAFDYDPEENLTFEIGYKQSTRLFGGPLNIIVTAFASDYTNLQQTTWAEVTPAGTIFADARRVVPDENDPDTFTIEDVEVPNSVGTLVTTNIAEATINGLEIEFDWRPYRNGRVFGWISYLDAEIGNLPSVDSWFCAERALLGLTPCPPENPDVVAGDPPAPQRTTNFKGNRLPWSPEFSLAINFEHNWWVADGVRVSPYVSVNWHSEIFFQNNNFDEGAFHSGQKETLTADVAIRFIDENKALAVEFFVRNITDELKRSWIDGGPGYTRASFYPPRHWGIKLNKRF
ncbi:MAG: TonB-dependent receptor domain-containing protein, partial [Parvibaculales bacterium]